MRQRLKKWREGQRGQAMVEFAAVLPLLLLIALSCLEFGWYFYTRSAVNQFAADALKCMPDPSLFVNWETRTGWKRLSEHPEPSWMTAEELAVWDSGNYDGWVAYQDLSAHLEGVYRANLQTVPTALKREEIQVSQPRGGWFVSVMAQQLPQENQASTGPVYTLRTPRSEYYYADVEIEVTYPFRPLSFLGRALFCRAGEQTSPISAKYRTEENVGQLLRSYG